MVAYNFVRTDKTLRCSPAMAADVSKRLWDIDDIVTMIEEWEARPEIWPDQTGTKQPSGVENDNAIGRG